MKRTSLLRGLFSRHLSLGLLVGAAALVGVACGATNDGSSFETSGSGQGGNSSGNGGVGGGFNPTTGSGGSTGSGFEECATSSDEATLVPLNMIVMFDRSGSMDSNNKWDDSTAALRAFLQDPGTAGLRVALRFFPTNDGCNGNSCATNVCAVPEVDAAELTSDPAPMDQQEELLVSAINNEDPLGNDTPIHAALGGATQWAKNYLVTNPTEKAVVVLVTDGEPNGCPEGSNTIASLAAEAFNSAGVYTYAVGLEGSQESLMNLIAQQGGTTQGIFIGSGANAEQELLTALQAIRGNQLACEFQMPESTNGEEIDPNKVNVEYTASSGGQPQVIQQVADAATCGPGGGWYYDNPLEPSAITLCPSTCQAVQADSEGSIRVVVGCATETAE